MEFDHLFICVNQPAPEAEKLIEFGLVEGSSNRHPGQGTENRRFFFRNAFIELLFAVDSDELKSDLTRPTRLQERLLAREPGVSPFGLCFRPGTATSEEPFDGWNYRPEYLPEHLEIKVAHAPVSEPMWFYLPFASRPDSVPADRRQPVDHGCDLENITSVLVYVTGVKSLSEAAAAVSSVAGVGCDKGEEHLLSIGFDDETQGKQHDFRPSLPLIFRW